TGAHLTTLGAASHGRQALAAPAPGCTPGGMAGIAAFLLDARCQEQYRRGLDLRSHRAVAAGLACVPSPSAQPQALTAKAVRASCFPAAWRGFAQLVLWADTEGHAGRRRSVLPH